MTDQQNGSIIRSESSSLSKAAPLGNPIVSRMAGDLLSRVAGDQVAQERIQLGDYSFRLPDHKQLMEWAETLGLDPIELVKTLERIGRGDRFQVGDGAILSLRWDLKVLPIPPNDWVEGLTIRILEITGAMCTKRYNLGFTSSNLPHLTDLTILGSKLTVDIIEIPTLERLWCSGSTLKEFRLGNFPILSSLSLQRCKLTELDLRYYAPRLYLLQCRRISLHDLDISLFPCLEILSIVDGGLNRIDLEPLPMLKSLCCRGNQLKELDLLPTPHLTQLDCSSNQLKELDLSPAPLLTELDCSSNQLQELDLSSVFNLTELNCLNNQITEIDLKPVPKLIHLGYDKPRIPNLDLTHTPLLEQVNPDWMGA